MKGVLTMEFTFKWLFGFIADNWIEDGNPAKETVVSVGWFIDGLLYRLFGWMFK